MITGQTLRDAILSGANNIANQRTRVDELNVFPVPDGDTGTNMSMTIGAARAELEAMPDSCTVAEASKTAASAMLRGARAGSWAGCRQCPRCRRTSAPQTGSCHSGRRQPRRGAGSASG